MVSLGSWNRLEVFLDQAFEEDVGSGDVTSESVILSQDHLTLSMRARENMVLAGMDIAKRCFERHVPDLVWDQCGHDGDHLKGGDILVSLRGQARGLLTAERVALNIVQHLSGIATLTARYVEAMNHPTCRLLDTRKTLPGWRFLQKYATRMGGAHNHRMGLYDGMMIKDNHLAVVGDMAKCVDRAKKYGSGFLEVECDTFDQVVQALDCGVDRLLLDNMGCDLLRQCVEHIGGRCETEASGGVSLQTIGPIAQTGVDFISVGGLTQCARAVDIGLDVME